MVSCLVVYGLSKNGKSFTSDILAKNLNVKLIPFDEVINSMKKVGEAMPHEHCCTGLGGLAMTPSAKKIEAGLENKWVKISC